MDDRQRHGLHDLARRCLLCTATSKNGGIQVAGVAKEPSVIIDPIISVRMTCITYLLSCESVLQHQVSTSGGQLIFSLRFVTKGKS